jgi:transcriptional regulator of acetoin/glycerol metabolism
MAMSTSIAAEGELRPVIERGWTRSALSGLDPDMDVRDPIMSEINHDSRLRRAAGPVLDSVAGELLDTRFALLLADRSAQIVDRRVGGRAPAMTLERVKAVPGVQYVESVSGTNSLSTVFETRQPVSVSGSEHYLEALRVFSCFGAPIIHPITGRFEGVLDIEGPHEHENDLLRPFLLRAVSDITERLRRGPALSDQRLFAEFQTRSARSTAPVVAFGNDLVLSNRIARDLLSESDMDTVQMLCEDVGRTRSRIGTVTPASGQTVSARIEHIDGTDSGTIIELELTGDAAARYSPKARFARPTEAPGAEAEPRPNQRILISGEPGSGKTTRARATASALVSSTGRAEPESNDFGYLDCLKVIGTGTDLSLPQLENLTRDSSVLVIDNVHVLDSAAAEVLRQLVGSFIGHAVLVSDCADPNDPALRSLQSLATQYENLPALRDLGAGFADVVDEVLQTISQTNRTGSAPSCQPLRIVPGALEVLRRQDWPGNRTELKSVLMTAARGRSLGDITLADLPITHQYPEFGTLSRLERLERRTILEALAEAGGNKKRAAAELGIGRTTLYARLRYYKIDS